MSQTVRYIHDVIMLSSNNKHHISGMVAPTTSHCTIHQWCVYAVISQTLLSYRSRGVAMLSIS